MKQLPVVRATVFAFLIALAAVGSGLIIGLRTANVVVANAVMFAIFAAGLALLLRWWLRSVRAAGLASERRVTGADWAKVGMLLLTLGATVALQMAAYALTHRRLLEIAVVAVAMPVVFVLTRSNYARLPAPLPNQLPLLRMNVVMLALLPLLTLGNVWMALRHGDVGLGGEFRVALSFLSIAITSLAAYFTYRRYSPSNLKPAR